MKLLFLTDNFPPEVNAPATRTYEHCVEWVKQGIDITVITCFPNFPQGKVYEGYRNKLVQKEVIDGIKVIRVWTYITANEGFLKRTLDYFSFAISSFIAGLTVKTDLIVATSPQFFTAACGRWLSVIKRKPWIMEVRDLWPESIKKVGAVKSGLALRYFELWEKRLYKFAKHIVVVTDSFKRNISSRGINPEKISVIKNGANLSLFTCRAKNSNIINRLGLKNKTIISYIGTLGMAHKLDFILNSIKKINTADYHFLFIGAGAEMLNLIKLKEELELQNVTFIDAIEKKNVPEYLSITDISLINLRKADLFKLVIPSKIFESAAMQIPILLGVDGESRQLIEEYHAGLYFEPENEDDFLEKLDLLASDKELYKSFQDGCKKLAADFERNKLAIRMLDVLKVIHQNEINNGGFTFYTPDSIQYKRNEFIDFNTTNNPLVSIILPAYNSIRFIEKTIASILKQEYINWELLITDDCSNDGTWEILNDYARKDKRIKLFRLNQNSGAGVARNNSIKNAKGRFIAFCDSDDQWKQDKLEKQLRFMIDNNLPLSYTSYDLIDEENIKKGKVKAPEKITYKTMLKNNYIGCLTAMYDTEKLGKVFMPEIRKRQDWAYWLLLLRKIPYAMGMQENLAIYRQRGKSVSSSKFDLLKYNWNIYRKEEKFSLVHSFFLISRFFYYYFKKKL